MTRLAFVFVSLTLGTLAGRDSATRLVSAADPPAACPKYKCIMAPAWWDGNGSNVVSACYSVPGFVLVPDALTDYFAPTSGYKLPTFAPGNNVDWRTHPGCFPLCGRVNTPPVWQAPQQVISAGPPNIFGVVIPATFCTATGQNENAPQSDDQSTQENPGTPPGLMTEETPIDPPPGPTP